MLKKVNKRRGSFSTILSDIKKNSGKNSDSIAEILFFKYKLTTYDFKDLYDDMSLKKKFDDETKDFLDEIITSLTYFEEQARYEYLSIYKVGLLDFINSDSLDVKEFFKDRELLQKALEYAFILEYNFYNYFFEVLEKKENTLTKKNLVAGVEIVRNIENGVKIEDGSVREFDIIDYYSYTKLPPNKMVFLLRKYANTPSLLFLKKFAGKNDNDYVLRESDIQKKLDDRTVFNCKFDENGKVIPGTGFEISDADKLFIFDYLRKNNIPVTDLTYSAGLRRFKNGVFKHQESEKVKELIMK